MRSIPARAGEPCVFAGLHRVTVWVYPRACGGTITCFRRLRRAGVPPSRSSEGREGLSPRVRGNPPRRRWIQYFGPMVYPRACGGTRRIRDLALVRVAVGLSPRVRGNQCGRLRRPDISCDRVYPRACGGTGEGFHRSVLSILMTVYPRACGGTLASTVYEYRAAGRRRSIPARAGEPNHGLGRSDVCL